MNKLAYNKLSLRDVYRNIYPWNSFNEFFELIRDSIAYKSPDGSLIALNKPFGVGTYEAIDRNNKKQNQDKVLYKLQGNPRYCLQDVLKPLAKELDSKKPYVFIKSIDRYMSGLVLITNDPEKHLADFKRSVATSRINNLPPFGVRAITSGYPVVPSNKIYERVGVELVEVDELGDHKEPIVVPKPTNKFITRKDMKIFQAELEVKQINREYSCALVDIYASNLKWDFARCYISSKTSFVLGDVRFSKRIREILGKPIQVSAFKSSHRYDDSYEPLNDKLRHLLGVSTNASIPLMLDLYKLRLKNFDRNRKQDLVIESSYMPLHFALTAERLNLQLKCE